MRRIIFKENFAYDENYSNKIMQFAGKYMGNEGPGRDEKESKAEKMREKKAGPGAEKKEMKAKPPAKKAVAPKRKAK